MLYYTILHYHYDGGNGDTATPQGRGGDPTRARRRPRKGDAATPQGRAGDPTRARRPTRAKRSLGKYYVNIILYYIILYVFFILYYTILYHIIIYYIILYNII